MHSIYETKSPKKKTTYVPLLRNLIASVSDPHVFFADPDPEPAQNLHADPDPDPAYRKM